MVMIENILKQYTLEFDTLDMNVEIGIAKDRKGLFFYEKVDFYGSLEGMKKDYNNSVLNYQSAKKQWDNIWENEYKK